MSTWTETPGCPASQWVKVSFACFISRTLSSQPKMFFYRNKSANSIFYHNKSAKSIFSYDFSHQRTVSNRRHGFFFQRLYLSTHVSQKQRHGVVLLLCFNMMMIMMMGTKSDMYVYVVHTIEEPSAATNGVIRLRPYSDHHAHARRRCSIIDMPCRRRA